MTQTTHPTKEQVRDYMERRTHAAEPPPDMVEVRRQLGWAIIAAEREAQERKERSE